MSQEGMEKAAKGMSTDDLGQDLERLNRKANRTESEELRRKIVEREFNQRPLHERVVAGAKNRVRREE